jgi:hypothetical protein
MLKKGDRGLALRARYRVTTTERRTSPTSAQIGAMTIHGVIDVSPSSRSASNSSDASRHGTMHATCSLHVKTSTHVIALAWSE